MYLTVEDSFKLNGDRHLQRSFNHLYLGHPDNYWQGSIDKALKNYNKAACFKFNPLTNVVLKPIIDDLKRYIEDYLIYGIAYAKTDINGIETYISAKDVYK